MFAHTASSFHLSLAHRLALSLIFITPFGCDGDRTELSRIGVTAPNSQEVRATPNAVLRWNAVASELILEFGPIIDSRAFTIMHAAIHDAVNGVERRYEPYAADLSSPGASLEVAVATAARDVLVALSPGKHERIEREYAAVLAAVPDGPGQDQGVQLGRRSARTILERRAGDKIPVMPWPPQSGPITEPAYVPTGKPGDYDFTPPFDRPPLGPIALFPGFGRLEPVIVDLSKHTVPGPDALRSDEYATDLNHLASVGSLHSLTRTADQAQTAFFWFEDFSIWNRIAIDMLGRRNADEWEAARTLALMHFAIADAGIACMAAKYRFRFWRPYTAIRRADEDDNPRTRADTAWLPLLWPSPEVVPPAFFIPPIPDYPSAAATVSAAAAAVLSNTFGDAQTFEATSETLPGVTRRFTSFTQAAQENGMSRVYGGIHFLRAVRDGARLGEGVGREVSRLLPAVRR